jgi:non-ribosomal peptide synthetase component F
MVGLWLPRGMELLTLQLAIAKTGAAWLPFDAETPTERIATCLDDANAKALLIAQRQTHLVNAQAGISAQVFSDAALLAPLPAGTALRRRWRAARPPGLCDLYQRLHGQAQGYRHHPGQHLPLSAQRECAAWRAPGRQGLPGLLGGLRHVVRGDLDQLSGGATLWLAPREIAGDPALPRALIEQQVTVLHAVPTLLALFAQDVPNLRLINLGGEMCPESLVARWANRGRCRVRCSTPMGRPRPRCRPAWPSCRPASR